MKNSKIKRTRGRLDGDHVCRMMHTLRSRCDVEGCVRREKYYFHGTVPTYLDDIVSFKHKLLIQASMFSLAFATVVKI